MIKLTKQVKASEDGVTINVFEPGEYDELPAVAMKRAVAIGAVGDAKGAEAEKAAREAKAKEKADAEAAHAKADEERKAEEAQAKADATADSKSTKGTTGKKGK